MHLTPALMNDLMGKSSEIPMRVFELEQIPGPGLRLVWI